MAFDLREVAKYIYFDSFCINVLEEQSMILTNFDIDGHGKRPRYVWLNAA